MGADVFLHIKQILSTQNKIPKFVLADRLPFVNVNLPLQNDPQFPTGLWAYKKAADLIKQEHFWNAFYHLSESYTFVLLQCYFVWVVQINIFNLLWVHHTTSSFKWELFLSLVTHHCSICLVQFCIAYFCWWNDLLKIDLYVLWCVLFNFSVWISFKGGLVIVLVFCNFI